MFTYLFVASSPQCCLLLAMGSLTTASWPANKARAHRQGCQTRSSASRFSLPRCQMTKVPHRPLQKSSHEGDQRCLPSGASKPQNKPSLIPRLLPDQALFITTKAQGPIASGCFFCFPGEPPTVTRLQLKVDFLWYPSSKQPQYRPKLHSHLNWRQWLMLGCGFMKHTENNQLATVDGEG